MRACMRACVRVKISVMKKKKKKKGARRTKKERGNLDGNFVINYAGQRQLPASIKPSMHRVRLVQVRGCSTELYSNSRHCNNAQITRDNRIRERSASPLNPIRIEHTWFIELYENFLGILLNYVDGRHDDEKVN